MWHKSSANLFISQGKLLCPKPVPLRNTHGKTRTTLVMECSSFQILLCLRDRPVMMGTASRASHKRFGMMQRQARLHDFQPVWGRCRFFLRGRRVRRQAITSHFNQARRGTQRLKSIEHHAGTSVVNILQMLWGPTQDGRRVTNTAYRAQNSAYVTGTHFNMRIKDKVQKPIFFFWRSQPTRTGLTICLLWGNCCHRTLLCHAPSLGVNPSWGDQYHSLQRTRPARSLSSVLGKQHKPSVHLPSCACQM